jgi:hypothetical protein
MMAAGKREEEALRLRRIGGEMRGGTAIGPGSINPAAVAS